MSARRCRGNAPTACRCSQIHANLQVPNPSVGQPSCSWARNAMCRVLSCFFMSCTLQQPGPVLGSKHHVAWSQCCLLLCTIVQLSRQPCSRLIRHRHDYFVAPSTVLEPSWLQSHHAQAGAGATHYTAEHDPAEVELDLVHLREVEARARRQLSSAVFGPAVRCLIAHSVQGPGP